MKRFNNFFAVDGPNGVGKSTVIQELKQQLEACHVPAFFTKEPTTTPLGNFIRQNQDTYTRHALAALVAADRYHHIETLILPQVSAGHVVISDRYLASSFVYQLQDGLNGSFIQALNAEVILPGHYFILKASVQTIAQRLAFRNELTRFEKSKLVSLEPELFREAGNILKKMGVTVHFIENENRGSAETARAIGTVILEQWDAPAS